MLGFQALEFQVYDTMPTLMFYCLKTISFFLSFLPELEMEPKVLHMLGKTEYSTKYLQHERGAILLHHSQTEERKN